MSDYTFAPRKGGHVTVRAASLREARRECMRQVYGPPVAPHFMNEGTGLLLLEVRDV